MLQGPKVFLHETVSRTVQSLNFVKINVVNQVVPNIARSKLSVYKKTTRYIALCTGVIM